MTEQEYELFYKKSELSNEEIENKIQKQAYQQGLNKRKYKNDGASYQNYIGMTKEKRAFEIEKERYTKEFKAETYQIFTPMKTVEEDISIAKQKIEEAKKKSPNNYWLNRYAMPGTI